MTVTPAASPAGQPDPAAPEPQNPPAGEVLTAAAVSTARAAADHPEVSVPLTAAAAAAIIESYLAGVSVATAAAAVFAALLALLAVARVRSARRGLTITNLDAAGPAAGPDPAAGQPAGWPAADPQWPHPRTQGGWPPAGDRPAEPARFPRPRDMADALRVAAALLADVAPGPERFTACAPGDVTVHWNTTLSGRRDGELDPGQADKMDIVAGRFRSDATAAGVLHQLPQLLLVTDTGAVTELFGHPRGRCGVVVPAAASVYVPVPVPAEV